MKDERVYLEHLRDAINDIKVYASVGEEAFLGQLGPIPREDVGLSYRPFAKNARYSQRWSRTRKPDSNSTYR